MRGEVGKLFLYKRENLDREPWGAKIVEASFLEILESFVDNISEYFTRFISWFNNISNENKIIGVLTTVFTYIIHRIVCLVQKKLKAAAETYARIAYIYYEDSERELIKLKHCLMKYGKVKYQTKKEFEKNFLNFKYVLGKFLPRKNKMKIPRVKLGWGKKVTVHLKKI